MVLNGVDESSALPLIAVKIQAQLLSSPESRDAVLSRLADWESSGAMQNPLVAVVAGQIYLSDRQEDRALRCVGGGVQPGCTLEMQAVAVMALIRLNRLEAAGKVAAAMAAVDDDSVHSQLAQAWVNSAQGTAKGIQDALFLFQELMEKFQQSAALLNATAVCLLQQGKPQEAEARLNEAMSLRGDDPDVLVNSIVCAEHLGKAEISQRSLQALKAAAPQHPFLLAYNAQAATFDNLAAAASMGM